LTTHDRPAMAVREVMSWARQSFGVDLVSCEPVDDGSDASAAVWCGVTRDHHRLALRVSTRPIAGMLLAASLTRRGVDGIPPPWLTRDGAVWSTRDGRRLSISTWVSDRVAAGRLMTAVQWRALGRLFADVHATELTEDLTDLIPQEDNDPGLLVRRTLELPWTVVRSPTPDDLTSRMASLLAGALDQLTRVAGTAQALGRQVRETPVNPVLCHGDPHPGNVLLDPDAAWLVDWEDAVIAPRERDLVLLAGGMLTSAEVAPREVHWFGEGYGPLDLDPAPLYYYACVRAMEDVVGLADRVLDTEHLDRAERSEALRTLSGSLSPAGIGRLMPDRWSWPPS
jgi:spectinomycin phosphotransferase